MKVVVATHGHCFDGLASAVVFTKLMRHVHGSDLQFEYHACGYGIGQQTPSGFLTGDVNAILDYRFVATEAVHWYFDHHRTAFGSDADRAFFEARRDNGQYFFEPDYTSCTKLIADIAKRRFGVDLALEELVRWADIIDSAAFPSAEAATDRSQPEMQLVSVVEQHGNDALISDLVQQLQTRPLAEVASSPLVQERFAPIGERQRVFYEAVKKHARDGGRAVYVDLTESAVDLIGKFVTYAMFPQSIYSVVVAKVKRGFKISVGYNPWSGRPLDTDISAICARYGGGGHPVVGGISLAEGERERALQIATDIYGELSVPTCS
jgi:hypothetical protein